MYTDQTLLPPPPLPSSPPRFTLPPIGSAAAFPSATLPRLAYTASTTVSQDDKTDRWQLPPLPALTHYQSSPAVSSPSSANHQHQHQHQPPPPRLPHQPAPPPSSAPSPWRAATAVYEVQHHTAVAVPSNPTASLIPRQADDPPYSASPAYARKQVTFDYAPPLPPPPPPTTTTTTSKTDLAAEYTERTLEIDREFQENKESIYLEKLKRLQEELSAIQHGGHEVFDDHMSDLEEERSKEIHDAQLMMKYRIQCAEKWYNEALRVVEHETEAEKRELKKAMLAIIEQKRKRIKEYRDEEMALNGDLSINAPQTRNRRRTRGAAAAANGLAAAELTLEQLMVNKNSIKPPKRRHNDRSRDLGSYVVHALNAKNEADLEADFDAMRQQDIDSSDEYTTDGDAMKRPKTTEHHGSTFHGRSSRR